MSLGVLGSVTLSVKQLSALPITHNNPGVVLSLRLYFCIAVKIAEVAWSIRISLAGQLR